MSALNRPQHVADLEEGLVVPEILDLVDQFLDVHVSKTENAGR
ncbi:hypothetical protein AB0C84_45300 [Actinomadura sp. NPDC048955]